MQWEVQRRLQFIKSIKKKSEPKSDGESNKNISSEFLCLIIFISVKAGEGFHLFGIENILFTINFGQAVDGVPSKFSFDYHLQYLFLHH